MTGTGYNPPKKGLGRIVLRVLGAMFSRPWEYMGEGAPNEWEFRVLASEDEDRNALLAVYNPHWSRKWILFRDVVQVAEVSLEEMNRRPDGEWLRFVEELDEE
jgi:hypothetical protein